MSVAAGRLQLRDVVLAYCLHFGRAAERRGICKSLPRKIIFFAAENREP